MNRLDLTKCDIIRDAGSLLSGFATFAPKFIEAQFSLQASTAAQYVGKACV